MSTEQASDTAVASVFEAKLDARLRALDPDALTGLMLVFEQLLQMLENDGTAVCAIDRAGSGNMMVAALGDQMLVGPIMSGLMEVHNAYNVRAEGPIQ
jgi:hypothetical protein